MWVFTSRRPGTSPVHWIGLPAVLAVALLVANSSARAEFKVGTKLPTFSLEAVGGTGISLQFKKGQVLVTHGANELAPKVLVLHLFQPDCLQCQAQMKELEKVYQTFGKGGLLVVGVAHRGDAAAAGRVAKQLKVTFPVLVGTGSELVKQFAAGDSLVIAIGTSAWQTAKDMADSKGAAGTAEELSRLFFSLLTA